MYDWHGSTEKGKGGGISLLPDFVLSKSILSEQEQNEILSALCGLSNIKAAETDQVLHKLSAIFNKTAVSWLEVDFTDWSFRGGREFNDFKTAILERRIAEFDYYSTYGEFTHRRIEPIQLWFKSKAWYVKGFCLTRQDVRMFRLTRVRNLMLTNEHFTERDLLAKPPNSGPTSHQKRDVTLKLQIAPEMAYRVYDEFDEDSAEKQQDGSFVVTVTWPEDEWVYGTILSYGEYAEVLEPEYMREIIKNKTLKTTKKYLQYDALLSDIAWHTKENKLEAITMSNYNTAMEIMAERFSIDSLIAIATTDGKRLYNRMVDALFIDGAFYVSTNSLSNKMKQIEANPEVAVCAVDWFSGHGMGKNLGWVLEPQNAEIRAKLREAFSWYDYANNEQDKNCCILEIRLTDGMLIKDHHAIRYQIDFMNKTALLSENWGEFK